jgi:hypothetical protein
MCMLDQIDACSMGPSMSIQNASPIMVEKLCTTIFKG